MNKNQWLVLFYVFLLLTALFIYQDWRFEKLCGTPSTWSMEEGSEQLQRYELWCINTEIYDPFIYLFGVLAFACLGCRRLEKK